MICKRCHQDLPIIDFQMRQKRYFRKNCRKCESALRLTRSPSRPSDKARARKLIYTQKWYFDRRRDPAFRAYMILKDATASDRKTLRNNDLTLEFIKVLISESCSYCGNNEIMSLSLDRIDNSVGHLQTNVRCACCRCNLIRGDMPFPAWMSIVPEIRTTFERGIFGEWYPKRRGPRKESTDGTVAVPAC